MRRLTALLFLSTLTAAPPIFATPADEFSALLNEVWEWQLENFPMFASQLGDKRFNDQWADRSLAAIEKRHGEIRGFLRRLYAIDREGLSESGQLNYELFRRELQNDVDGFGFRGWLLPFDHRGGIQNLENNVNYLDFQSVKDFDDWLSRLAAIEVLIDRTIDLAEKGRREGFVASRELMSRVPKQIDLQIVDEPKQSPYFRLFATLPESIDPRDQERLRRAARAVIRDSIVPAYRRLARYFNDTYLPACRAGTGLSELPNGEAWYEFLARIYTTTRMTPDDIHRLGLDEVRRLRSEMDDVIAEIEFSGDFAAFIEYLRKDPQFYFEDPDELYEAYLATSKRIDPELVKQFGKLPRMPYGVKPIPDSIAPDTTTAYYSSPAADGSRAGIFWVNLYKPEVRPKYEIEVLTVHEAMPGHHLQLSLQQELDDLPNFRRYGGFTAFIEGWGLYSEYLGYDLGLYRDPYSRFGQLTYEMWRALRLVVDTGLHYKGWTRQQAIDFFKDNAARTELDIINEVDRYIGTPGQALAYKVGQLKMLALRRNAEAALGDQFDVRAFHDELLGAGALPLDLLEQRMDAWLDRQL